MDVGIYIHYPWCRSRCAYCDFAIAVGGDDNTRNQGYLQSVLQELAARIVDFQSGRLVSIYLGGGTPSLWSTQCVAILVKEITQYFPDRPLEVTLEANPIDCVPDKCAAWIEAGITRLSLGVQSFAAQDFVTLGRDRSMGEAESAIATVAKAGFTSWSIDLMLAVPGADTARNVDLIMQAGAPHVSIYELTFEPGTPLTLASQHGKISPVNEDIGADEYGYVHDTMTANGYEHYEISSYGKPGHQAVHNSLYWSGQSYLGVGNGAHSLLVRSDDSAIRTSNPRQVARYLAEPLVPAETTSISAAEHRRDRLWLGLRTKKGVALHDLESYPGLALWLGQNGLISTEGDRAIPTFRGFLYNNQISAKISSFSAQ